MITYDKVWESYVNNYMVSDIQVPKDPDVIFSIIGNAVDLLNNRLRLEGVCNNSTESISGIPDNQDYILLVAHYIKLTSLKKEKTFVNSLWNGVQGSNDIGMKNYRPQMSGFERSISDCERDIENFIFNTLEDMWE